ncbi:MAG: hypothetical protein R2692_02225 [Microbacterium sp.]
MTAASRSLSLLALIGAGALLLAAAHPARPPGSTLRHPRRRDARGRARSRGRLGSTAAVRSRSSRGLSWDACRRMPRCRRTALAVTLDDGPAGHGVHRRLHAAGDARAGASRCRPDQGPRPVVTDAHGTRGDTDLDGVAGLVAGGATDYAPSAGWVDDDLIAVLTWGSSSCAPVVSEVSASDPKNVTVTFADQDDKPCTMDMAPRATLVSVAGLGADDDGTTITSSGADAQFATPVTVPVIG